MMKKGALTAAVLFVLIAGILGAVLLYSGSSGTTGAVAAGNVCCLTKIKSSFSFDEVGAGSCTSGTEVHHSWCGPGNQDPVPICHNKKEEISVPKAAVPAHAAHGDNYGNCKPSCYDIGGACVPNPPYTCDTYSADPGPGSWDDDLDGHFCPQEPNANYACCVVKATTTTTSTTTSTTDTTEPPSSTSTTVTVPSTTSTTSGGGSTTTTTSGGGSTTTTETPSTTTTTTPTVTSTTTPPSTTSTTQPCANPNSCFGDLDCCPEFSCKAGTCVS